MDPYLRATRLYAEKQRAWYADQYRHPHESKHSTGEVLRWFDSEGVEFLRGIPSVIVDAAPLPIGDLFTPQPRGTRFEHFLAQAAQVATGSREGGFFLMIGQKKASRGAGSGSGRLEGSIIGEVR